MIYVHCPRCGTPIEIPLAIDYDRDAQLIIVRPDPEIHHHCSLP